jgi:hypothetical protein
MGALTIVAVLIVVVLLGLLIWRMSAPAPRTSDAIDLYTGSTSGKERKAFKSEIPRSFNQSQGITFTYTGWILINDFTFNYGSKRLIFTRNDCPGLYLDTTSNSLLVVVNTYGATESILIPNMTAKKWIHFAIVVDQDAVDVYINGLLRQHHSLSQIPRQTESQVIIGDAEAAGWDGVLSNLQYTPRSLSAAEISALTANVPVDDLHKTPSGPGYFDMTWYVGRT